MSHSSPESYEAMMAAADAAARGAEDSTAQSRPQHGVANPDDGSRTGQSASPGDVATSHVVSGARTASDGAHPDAVMSDVGGSHPVVAFAAERLDWESPGPYDGDQRSVTTVESAPTGRPGQVSRSDAGRASPVSRSSSRPGSAMAPGTQFSRVSRLWRSRESTTKLSRRKSPVRSVSRATAVMRSSLGAMEQKVQTLAEESAQSREQTLLATQQALEAVQGIQREGQSSRQDLSTQMDNLRIAQSRQEGQVQVLQHEVRKVRHDATEMNVAAGLSSKTEQVQKSLELDAQFKRQQDYMDDVVSQLKTELQRRADKDKEKEAVIAQLKDTVEKEKQARKSLQEYVEDVEKAFISGTPSPAPAAMDVDQKISIADIAGAKMLPAVQTADFMHQGPPPHVQYSSRAPVVTTAFAFQPAMSSVLKSVPVDQHACRIHGRFVP